jgi:hypothetical protein
MKCICKQVSCFFLFNTAKRFIPMMTKGICNLLIFKAICLGYIHGDICHSSGHSFVFFSFFFLLDQYYIRHSWRELSMGSSSSSSLFKQWTNRQTHLCVLYDEKNKKKEEKFKKRRCPMLCDCFFLSFRWLNYLV